MLLMNALQIQWSLYYGYHRQSVTHFLGNPFSIPKAFLKPILSKWLQLIPYMVYLGQISLYLTNNVGIFWIQKQSRDFIHKSQQATPSIVTCVSENVSPLLYFSVLIKSIPVFKEHYKDWQTSNLILLSFQHRKCVHLKCYFCLFTFEDYSSKVGHDWETKFWVWAICRSPRFQVSWLCNIPCSL